MVCPAYEDLLVAYDALEDAERSAVDAHLRVCAGCSDYLTLLSHLDQSFSTFAAMTAPVNFRRALSRRMGFEQKPSIIPEILDLSIGAGVILATGLLLSRTLDDLHLVPVLIALLFGLSVWIALQAYNELRT
jgi:hypothetical protein